MNENDPNEPREPNTQENPGNPPQDGNERNTPFLGGTGSLDSTRIDQTGRDPVKDGSDYSSVKGLTPEQIKWIRANQQTRSGTNTQGGDSTTTPDGTDGNTSENPSEASVTPDAGKTPVDPDPTPVNPNDIPTDPGDGK